MFTSVAAPPQAAPQAAPQSSSVVYPPGQVQPVSEIMDQLNQLKFVVSDLKLGFSDLKMSNNETRLELAEHRGQLTELMVKNGCRKKPKKNELMVKNGCRNKPKKNKGLCMQGTILAFVILIIGVVLVVISLADCLGTE
jgi:hypothetical protein